MNISIEKIKLIGDGQDDLGFAVLQKDHFEWEPPIGISTYSADSLKEIAYKLRELTEKYQGE